MESVQELKIIETKNKKLFNKNSTEFSFINCSNLVCFVFIQQAMYEIINSYKWLAIRE